MTRGVSLVRGTAFGRASARAVADARDGLSSLVSATVAALSDAAALADRAGLMLLVLAVGTLLFRPADFAPALAEAPLYEYLLGACLVASVPRVGRQITARALRANAVTAVFLLLVPAVMLSHLSHANTYDARVGGGEMLKACALFLLIVGHADSPARLRAMLLAVAGGVLAMTVLALAQYHGYVNLAALRTIEQRTFDAGNPTIVRLCGVGVFDDPNDYSLILITAMAVCAYELGVRRSGWARWMMLGPIALFAYALALTHSRGGLLSAVAALLAFLPARVGWRNALPLSLLVVPPLLVPFWGRMTSLNLDNPEDTFQMRLELWNNSIDAFRASPLLGIGQGKLVDAIGQVAHNSYLHAFAELGMLGGTAFVGGFFLVASGLRRASPRDGELARLRPYLLAMTVGYAAGLVSLSRCYSVPTLLIPALATAYLVLVSRSSGERPVLTRFDAACVARLVGLAVVLLVATLLFVRLMWHPEIRV